MFKSEETSLNSTDLQCGVSVGAQQAASCVCSIRTDIIEHFQCDLVTERCISGAQQAVYQWGTAGSVSVGHSRRCPAYVLIRADITEHLRCDCMATVRCICSVRKDITEQHRSTVRCINGGIAGGVLRMFSQNRHH